MAEIVGEFNYTITRNLAQGAGQAGYALYVSDAEFAAVSLLPLNAAEDSIIDESMARLMFLDAKSRWSAQ